MPELPEVETTKEGIRPHIEGQIISTITLRNSRLRIPVAPNLDELCVNKTVDTVTRRGKYLILKLTEGHLLIHLGMSGHLRVLPENTPPGKHDHIDVGFKNQLILRYCDPRRFGLFHYFNEEPTELSLLSRLGPEPLTEAFNSNYLYQKTRDKNLPIKALIMTNEVVVGVGNIYASESLFLAGINPVNKAKSLSLEQCDQLTQHIKNVLQIAIQAGGTTLKDYYGFDGKPGYFTLSLNVYGRKSQACLQCNTVIEAAVIAGRQSAFCPQCQPHCD